MPTWVQIDYSPRRGKAFCSCASLTDILRYHQINYICLLSIYCMAFGTIPADPSPLESHLPSSDKSAFPPPPPPLPPPPPPTTAWLLRRRLFTLFHLYHCIPTAM
ncbi:hypothetical protein L1887_26667 [Cichorium endivia]|nr:hypothetical protein L1887_26667 [Cichorium endivia]